MQRLTPAQIEHFQREGYLILRQFFDRDAVRQLLESMVEVLKSVTRETPYVAFDPWPGSPESVSSDDLNPNRVIYVNDLFAYAPTLAAHLQNPALLDVMVDLLGNDIDVFQSATIIKPPHMNFDYHGWHQDAFDYGRLANRQHAATITYLGAVGPDQGSTSLVPRSHHGELLEQDWIEVEGWPARQRVLKGFERYEANIVTPHFQPGDVLVFSSWLMHRANSNYTDQSKIGLINVYHAADCLTAESAGQSKVTGMPLVRSGQLVTVSKSE
jgi:ectoine hydroxylase-related dioxygenase (phytanoyl-CoA dioxygenase family)